MSVEKKIMPIMLIVLFVGAYYGTNLLIFPSAANDYFELKSYGLNYGILFTAWGVGGLFMPRVNGMIQNVQALMA
jgi:MFS transporter, OFA family, oxalate/formate antiporter